MKKITLKHLSLTYFKGIEHLDIDFKDDVTTISGRNGTGKTTVMDAIIWLLFGKDSLDRKQFNIKTLGENGKVIEKLPHEVSATLDINGEEISLRRCYKEKWQKKRGAATEEFNGHEEERYFNDVPCNTTEWAEKINAIVTESDFKYITNPSYFPSRKPDDQRKKLCEMAGDMSNEVVAAGNPKFLELLQMLKGKTLDELKREIGSKKKRYKEEAEGLPYRIDECKRSMPKSEDWAQLEKELEEAKNEQDGLDVKSTDILTAYQTANKQRQEKADEISRLEAKKQKRIYDIRQQVSKSYYDKLQEKSDHDSEIRIKEAELDAKKEELDAKKKLLAGYNESIAQLRKEWSEISSRTFEFDPEAFVCPTCKRQLEVDDIEKKHEELEGNFNKQKSKELEANKAKGFKLTEQIAGIKDEIKKMEAEIEALQSEIEKMKAVKFPEITEPDATEAIDKDAEVRGYTEEIESKQQELGGEVSKPDTGAITARQGELREIISSLNLRLSKKAEIENKQKRIEELEEQTLKLNNSIAELEGVEMTIMEFSKARATLIESRVNGMFKLVKFKMFDMQVNGAEVETCVATVNGVPYNDGLNQAAKVNAGVDIINAISEHLGVCAPIVIDNSESINELIPTRSQLIRLVVTNDKQLTIS